MPGWLRRLGIAMVCATLAALGVGTGTASAQGVAQQWTPNAVPMDRTPQVLDTADATGRVVDFAAVGNRIVVAGNFGQVRDANGNGGATFNRGYIFSFDPVSGAVDQAFVPTVNGMVNTVIAGPNNTVYLGGQFSQVDGVAQKNVAQVSLTDGSLVTAFKPAAPDGAVQDLVLSNNRLFVAGSFTKFGSSAHGGLAALSPATGAVDPYLGVNLTGHHNYPTGTAQAPVGAVKIDVNPAGDRLVAIGNFKLADGLSRDQLVMIDLGTTSAVVDPTWATTGYSPTCSANAFDYYVRSVQFSPDGSYFAVVSTGGPYAGTLCDSMVRWETAPTGSNMTPTWVDHTGGDTLLSVAVTGSAIYAGGHERWMNNTNGSDSAGQGAVPRPGLVAADPRTGIPLAWNPGRNPRGVGAEALLATPNGLYVGSDTEWIGDHLYFHPRLAFFPLAGGGTPPDETTGALPANVFLGGRATATATATTTDVLKRYFDGTTPSADAKTDGGGIDWSRVRGAFIAGGTLFYGYPNAAAGNAYYLFKRTYDGTTYGPATAIDPYNDPYWSTVAAGTKNGTTVYYRGKLPTFYSQLSSITGMFFSNGRLYYTRSGQTALFYRGFSLDSGVVGADEFKAASSGFNDVAGMMISGNTLYWASQANGQLRMQAFVNGVPSGAVSTANSTQNWRTRAMFLGPGGPPATINQPPVANAAPASCAGLSCSIDGSGSTDPDGGITGYSWDFGDGTTPVTGSFATHTYAAAGTYTITLTVTDTSGATNTAQQVVTVAPQAPGTGIGFRAEVDKMASGVTSASVTVPSTVQSGDGMVLVVTTNSNVTSSAAPAGWTLEDTLVSSTSLSAQVFSRVAGATDAGSTVTVGFSASVRANLQLVAYSGTSATDPVATVTHAADVGGTSHTTPTATATAYDWVLSLWADKSSTTHQWTAPSGVTVRSNLSAASGQVAALLADGNAPVPNQPVGGLTATVPVASNRALMFTILLAPAS